MPPPTPLQLAALTFQLNAVNTAGAAVAGVAAASKVYELFLLLRVGQTAIAGGSVVGIFDWTGAPSPVFVYRGAPGNIDHAAPPPMGTSYPGFLGVTSAAGNNWEIHNSVRFAGVSGVLHELDVSWISQATGNACRNFAGPPLIYPAAALWAAEAKNFGAPLPLDIGRSQLGLLQDVPITFNYLVTNQAPNVSINALLAFHAPLVQRAWWNVWDGAAVGDNLPGFLGAVWADVGPVI